MRVMNKTNMPKGHSQSRLEKKKNSNGENVGMTKIFNDLEHFALCVIFCPGRSHRNDMVGLIECNVIKLSPI